MGQGFPLKGQGTWVKLAGHCGPCMNTGLRRVTATKAAGKPDAPSLRETEAQGEGESFQTHIYVVGSGSVHRA